MLANLFKYPAVLARHQNAPLLEERERYLRHRAEHIQVARRGYRVGRAERYVIALRGALRHLDSADPPPRARRPEAR